MPSTLKDYLETATTLGAGGVLLAVVQWGLARLSKRQDAKAAEPAAMTEAAADLVRAFSPAVQDLLEDYRNQLHFVRAQQEQQAGQISALEREHAGCREELAATRAELAAALSAHRLEIADLMASHPPAEYGPALIAGAIPPTRKD